MEVEEEERALLSSPTTEAIENSRISTISGTSMSFGNFEKGIRSAAASTSTPFPNVNANAHPKNAQNARDEALNVRNI